MSKQEIIVKKRKHILVASLLLVTFFGLISFSINSKATESREIYKYYTSYEVKPGDSLWTIADTYMVPEFNDRDEYINEVKRLNHLLDDEITSGEYIVLCYYSYEVL